MFPVSYRQHGGIYYYRTDYDNSYSGWEKQSGAEWSLFNSMFSYSDTYYDREGTKFDQYRNTVRLGSPFVNLQIENDAGFNDIFKFPWMPDHHTTDMYMSSEIWLRLFGVELGNTIFTGRPDKNAIDPDGPNGTYGLGESNPDQYRAGVLYIKLGLLKFGPNNETIRDKTQNWLHDKSWIHTPRFRKLDRPNKWLWQFGW